jgi:hypothetical protein
VSSPNSRLSLAANERKIEAAAKVRRVVQHVRLYPGRTKREIAESLHGENARYALNETSSILSEHCVEREGRWYLAAAAPPAPVAQETPMPQPHHDPEPQPLATRARILAIVRAPMPSNQIAAALRWSGTRDGLAYHLRALADEGRLVRTGDRNSTRWGPAPVVSPVPAASAPTAAPAPEPPAATTAPASSLRDLDELDPILRALELDLDVDDPVAVIIERVHALQAEQGRARRLADTLRQAEDGRDDALRQLEGARAELKRLDELLPRSWGSREDAINVLREQREEAIADRSNTITVLRQERDAARVERDLAREKLRELKAEAAAPQVIEMQPMPIELRAAELAGWRDGALAVLERLAGGGQS